MYPISSYTTRILVDIPDSIFRHLGSSSAVRGYLQERVAPVVPEVLQPQLRLAIKNGRLRSMPNAWMPSTRNTIPGLIMVGDASNMRHPITGSGMTVALKDAVLLARLLDPADIPHLSDSEAVLRAMRSFHWNRKAYSAQHPRAGTLSPLCVGRQEPCDHAARVRALCARGGKEVR